MSDLEKIIVDNLRVLVTSPPFLKVVEKYRGRIESNGIELVLRHPEQYFTEAEMKEMIQDFDGMICGDDLITEEVLRNANKLKVLSKWGVGIDSIDRDAAERRGIPVCNSAGAFSDACADVAMGYLLMLARSLHRIHSLTMSGSWEKIPGVSLRGRTLGIIGVGNIGRQVARRGIAFGLRVIGNDIRPVPSWYIEETGIEIVDKDMLLSESDFIVVSCDLNPSSRYLINTNALRKMKRLAYLINIARGLIIDTRALVDALRNREIAGAALDVFEEEPLPLNSPLRLLDNCILGAHNAYNGDADVEFVHRNTVDNLLEHLLKTRPDIREGKEGNSNTQHAFAMKETANDI